MKLGIYQMADRGDPRENLAKAYEAIMDTQADFFVLPEFFVLPGGDFKREYTLAEAYRETGKPGEEMLEKASRSFPGYIIGGTLIEETPEGYYNTCYVFKGGRQVAKYRKIHITQEEIDMQLMPGKEIVTFHTDFARIGLMVCADSIYEETRDRVGSQCDLAFLPISMTDPNHPKVEGHPLSEEMAQKHNVTIVKVSRVGFYDGQPLVSRSAVIAPWEVLWEASEEREDLAVVEIPTNGTGGRKQ